MGQSVKLPGKIINPYGYGDKYGNTILTKRVTLTATQLRALYSTPQTLVAAPGTRKYHVVEKIICALDYSGGALSNGTLEFRENNGSGTKIAADVTTFLNSTADAVKEVSGIEAETTRLLNKAIVVDAASSNPTGAQATSTLTITVFYRECTPFPPSTTIA